MSERKELGKISAVRFGDGGYQDAMIGVTFDLRMGECSGVNDFWGAWRVDPSPNANWTAESRNLELGAMVMRLSKLMDQAKVRDLASLAGTPVEVTFDGMELKSWRVLTEVL